MRIGSGRQPPGPEEYQWVSATVGDSLMSLPTDGHGYGARSFLEVTHPSIKRDRRCLASMNEPLS